MFWLGAVISLASVPGWTSISIPAGWAAMSLAFPPLLWRGARLTPLHFCFLGLIGYAILGLAWTPEWHDGIWRIWQLSLIYMAFYIGTSLQSIEGVIRGLAWGGVVSTIVAVVQALGLPTTVLGFSPETPAGLFFNPAIAGQTLALLAVACFAFNRWTLATLLIPGIYLSGSRGGFAILGLGLVLNLTRSWRLLVFAILINLIVILFSFSPHDLERVAIWHSAVSYLTPLGHGPGSFISLYFSTPMPDRPLVHPVDVHNDLLQLLFEFGIVGAISALAVFGSALRATHRPEWVPLACFIFLSFFAFPSFVPISACLAALCAGRIAAIGDWTWISLSNRGRGFIQGDNAKSAYAGPFRRKVISILTGTP